MRSSSARAAVDTPSAAEARNIPAGGAEAGGTAATWSCPAAGCSVAGPPVGVIAGPSAGGRMWDSTALVVESSPEGIGPAGNATVACAGRAVSSGESAAAAGVPAGTPAGTPSGKPAGTTAGTADPSANSCSGDNYIVSQEWSHKAYTSARALLM